MSLRLLLIGLLSTTACVVDESTLGLESGIVDGTPESGRPEVMFLYNAAVGSACTATLIAPRLVLTAKHCVQLGDSSSAAPASQFRLFVGQSANRPSAQYNVSEVRPAPGRWDLRDASDVALLILSSAASQTPREVSFDNPGVLVGGAFTAVGYGQTPSGGSGSKFTTSKTVDGTDRGFIYVRPSVCSGDSGGPLIGTDERIWGVASFIYSEDRAQPRCGSAPGAYNSLFAFRSLIETALEDSGSCVPREEICNSEDDNCDGEVDEGCTPIGELCTDDAECAGAACRDLGAGRVCTQACDPLRPDLGCPGDFYCQWAGGCDGFCATSGAAMLPLEAECTDSSECESLFCVDPGDGRQRCLAPCRGDAGACLSGEVCAAVPGACGGCVPAGLVAAPRGIGEPCTEGTECRSEICFEDEGASYCSRECTMDEDCGSAGYHCRGDRCARGPLEDVGGGCVTNEDCGSGFCATRGTTRWCTTGCADASECPDGFACTMVSADLSVCDPVLALVGEACMENVDCETGLCARGTVHGDVCTRECGAELSCSPGFECVRIEGGSTAICIRPEDPPGDGGGCSIGSGTSNAAWLTLYGLLFVWRRRR